MVLLNRPRLVTYATTVLIICLCLVGFSIKAAGAISRDGTCTAATTSCTFSATATNSLKLIFAYRSGSTTAPTLPAGWTTITTLATSATGTTGAMRIGCNYSSSSGDTGSGTWTNATSVTGISYSGTVVGTTATCNITGIGAISSNQAKASTTVNFAALVMHDSHSNSWVTGFVGSNVTACTPSGMTSQVTANSSTNIGNDTNATVSGWSSTNCTISSGTWITAVVEVMAPTSGGTIQVVQAVKQQSTSGTFSVTGAGTADTRFTFGTQAGNCIAIFGMSATGSGTLTASDDKGNSYIQVPSTNATHNSLQLFQFFAQNIIAGTRKLSVSPVNTTAAFELYAVELTNCGAVDAWASNAGTSTSITAGSWTPTQSGDFALQYTVSDGGPTSVTVGSQANITWRLAVNDLGFSRFSQQGTYSSTSALNPTMAQSPSSAFMSESMAIRTATYGGFPTGIYVPFTEHMDTSQYTVTSHTFPCQESARILSYNGTSGQSITSVTGSASGSWTKLIHSAANGSSNDIWAVTGQSGSDTDVIDIVGTTDTQSTAIYYCVHGLATSSAIVVDGTRTTGGNAANTSNQTGPTFSPSAAGSLIICNLANANNAVLDVTGDNFLNHASRFTGEIDAPWDRNNGFAVDIPTSTSSIAPVWHFDGTGGNIGDWNAVCGEVKALTGGIANQFPRIY